MMLNCSVYLLNFGLVFYLIYCSLELNELTHKPSVVQLSQEKTDALIKQTGKKKSHSKTILQEQHRGILFPASLYYMSDIFITNCKLKLFKITYMAVK